MKLSNKNHKGSALFTVVSVMMILMILVMGTFILVSAAHQKAMTNYYNNQSYVTAKSVVDAFVNKLASNPASDAEVSALRAQLIGTYNSTTDKMVGGMDYIGRPSGESPTITNVDTDPNNNYCFVDVKVELPKDASGYNYGLGELSNPNNITDPDTIRIHRIDMTNFKVTATVKSGEATNPIIRTVSEKITLASGASSSLFDSSMIARSGATFLHNEAMLFGGYVNGSMSSPSFDGSGKYVGNFYSNANIKFDGTMPNFCLSSDKKSANIGGVITDSYMANYIESPNGISSTEISINISNVKPSGETTVPVNPYLYSSTFDDPVTHIKKPSSINLVGNSGGFVIGSSGHPVDLYSDKDITLKNVTVYGNLYAKGSITLMGTTSINGDAYYGSAISGSLAVTGDVSSNIGAIIFPQSYNLQEYKPITSTNPLNPGFLQGTDYHRDGSSTPDKLKDLFLNEADAKTGNFVAGTVPIGGGVPIIPNTVNIDSTNTNFIKKTYLQGSSSWDAYIGSIYGEVNNKTINIIVKENEDIFITFVNNSWDYNLSDTVINVIPDLTVTDWTKMGNVYIFMPTNKQITISNTRVGMDPDSYVSDTATKYYGTKNILGTLEKPSHLYMLISSNNATYPSGSTNFIYGYIYAPEFKIDQLNGNTLFSSTKYFDNNVLIKNNTDLFLAETPQPIIVGSCIANALSIYGNAASIYIPPDESIFTKSQTNNLGNYDWYPAVYNNH